MKLPFSRRNRAHEGWLAASLGERTARFAHVKPGGRPTVVSLEEREWDAAEPRSLERVARTLGAQRQRCTTLLAPSQYQVLQVEAPNVRREELKAAVRWRIKDMIDYHVDDATLDVLDVPSAGAATARPASMYVVVARNQVVQDTMARFDQARIALSVIDIPDTAQRNIATLYEVPERAVLVLSFDADGGLITVSAGGELYLTRRLELAYGQVNACDAQGERAFDRVLVEVQRSLDHFERHVSQVAVSRVLVAPMEQSAALAKHLAAQLYLPVEAMDLADVMDLPPGYAAATPEARVDWFRLIGAGLRVEETVL